MILHSIRIASRKSCSPAIVGLVVISLILTAVTGGNRQTAVLARTTHSDGDKAIRAGNYDRAVKIFLDAIKSDRRDISAHNGAALAYLKLQQSKLVMSRRGMRCCW